MEKGEQCESCHESKWASAEQLGVQEEGQEYKQSILSKYVRIEGCPNLLTRQSWEPSVVLKTLPFAVTSIWNFYLSMLSVKAGLPKKSRKPLFSMYFVKRVTSAPSLYVSWFSFKGEHGGSIVTVPRYCHACCRQKSFSAWTMCSCALAGFVWWLQSASIFVS